MKERDRPPNFEELLRRKAAGFKQKPSDDVWANVKISLQENKRRRGFFWMWAAAIGLLLGAGVFGWMMFSDRPVPTLSNQIINSPDEQQVASSPASKPGQESIEQSIPPISGNDSSTENNSNKTRISSAEETVLNSNNQIPPKKSITASSKTETNLKNTQTQQTEQDVTTSGTIISTEAIPLISQTIIPDTNQSVAASHPGPVDTSATAVLKSDSDQQLNEVALAKAIREDSLAAIALLTPTGTEDYRMHRFSVEGEVIPLISYRVLNLQSDNGAQEDLYNYTDSLTSLTNTYSSPEFGYSAGINFQYLVSKKFALTGGLHLTNTGYKISHSSIPNSNAGTSADTMAGTAFGAMNYYFYPPGSDFSEVVRFKWLDVSLSASWIFWQQGKNEVSVGAGIGVSKFLQYKSSNADNQKTVITYSSIAFSATSNSTGVKANEFTKYALTSFAALNYQRTLSTHFSVSGGLQFHYYLTNVLSKEFYNTLHPYWAGMNLGFTYHF